MRVNAICPGVIHTEMLDRIAGGDRETMERMKRYQPMPRLGEPDDVARLALYQASDDESFVTGAAFPIDGGYTAR
ncbi:MAG: SDR family oxidoreductase [Dehalococcoidia bacterium]